MTINFDALEYGTPIEEIVPRYKKYLSDLASQRRKFEKQEEQAGLGPEPTRSAMTLGADEMWQIKKMSSFPYGDMIIRNVNKGINVLSILDESQEEADEYRSHWKSLDMDSKLELLKRDRAVGSVCFSEVGLLPSGRAYWNVKSPKKVTTFSADPVNNRWADFAIEVFTNSGVNYLRYFDDKVILTFKESDSSYILEEWEQHKIGVCPIVPAYNSMNSDGIATGKLELVEPVLDTLRQRSNSVSQAVYWSGTRTFVIENLDLDEVRHDPTTGEEYLLKDRVMDNITMTDAGVVLLPSGTTQGENPTLSQTEESNLGQLIEAKKDILRDLASVTGLPYHLFDGTAVPSTAEGSIQAYNSHSDDKNLDKMILGNMIERIMSRIVFAETGEEKEFSVLWSVSEQVSINSIADTISKLATSNIPLPWIVRNVLAGYRPGQIQELLDLLAQRTELETEQTKFIVDGI